MELPPDLGDLADFLAELVVADGEPLMELRQVIVLSKQRPQPRPHRKSRIHLGDSRFSRVRVPIVHANIRVGLDERVVGEGREGLRHSLKITLRSALSVF